MAIQIQLRRGTASEWTAANPILAQGEFGYESDTTKFKVGNGTASWSVLSYASGGFDAAAASPIFLTRSSASATYAPLVSASFTGIPTAPTANSGTNTKQIATTEFVRTEVTNLIDSAPGALDTLNELAAALNDDANFSTTVTNSLAAKLDAASASALYVPDATFTAKGDILAGLGSGTFNNLPVGPNTYVLTADTSASAGIKWAAAAEAGFNAFLLMGA